MTKPEFVKIGDKKYKINTNYMTAIECDSIAKDSSIKEYEKALAIIYLLFGDEGLSDFDNHAKLLELGQKYLACGLDLEKQKRSNIDMDFIQDMDFIIASFRSDYAGLDLENEDMHWWSFNKLLNGLTEDSVLNRVRFIRNYDISEIKDPKERKRWVEQKEAVALHTNNKFVDSENKEKLDKFYKLAKIERKE